MNTEVKWRCGHCNHIITEFIDVPHPLEKHYDLSFCSNCNGVVGEVALRLCDEPGCNELVSHGTPTPNGFRNTCGRHIP